MRRRIIVNILRLVTVVGLILLWQVSVTHGLINKFTISSPADVWTEVRGWAKDGSLWTAIGETMRIVVIGYPIGLAAGILVGVAVGLSDSLRLYLDPFLVFTNAIPKFVLIPFLITWFGFGWLPGVVLTVIVIFFVVAFTIQNSVRELEAHYIENARALGASWLDVVRDVYAPSVGVWILSTARLCIGIAFQAAIVSEFFGSSGGLGFRVTHGMQFFDAREMFAAIIVTLVLAWVLDIVFGLVDRRVSRWVPERGR